MTHTSLHHSSSTTPLKALLLCILLTALSFYPFTSEAAEKLIEKTVQISDFSKVSASSGIQVKYTQGKSTGIAKIAVSSELEKYLKVEVKNHCLNVYYDFNNRASNKANKFPTVVTVQSSSLSKVQLSSAAQLSVSGNLSMNSDIDVNLSSAAKADFNTVTCTELEADISSAASMKVKQLKGNLDIDCTSAASASIENVNSAKADLDCTSAATINVGPISGGILEAGVSSGGKINISNIDCRQVIAIASSGGSVTLSGKCGNFRQSTSSGGKVSTKGFATDQSVRTGTTEDVTNMESLRDQMAASRKALEEQRLALEEQRKQLEIQRKQLAEQRQQLAEQRREIQQQMKNTKKVAAKAKNNAKKKKATGNSDSAYVSRNGGGLKIP